MMQKKIDQQFARLQGKEEVVEETKVTQQRVIVETEDDKEIRKRRIEETREIQNITKKKNDTKKVFQILKVVSIVCGLLLVVLMLIASTSSNWKNCKTGDLSYTESITKICTKNTQTDEESCVKNEGRPARTPKLIPDVAKDPDCRAANIENGLQKVSDNCTWYNVCVDWKIQTKYCNGAKGFFNAKTATCEDIRPLYCKDVQCDGKPDNSKEKVEGTCGDFTYCRNNVFYKGSCTDGDYFDADSRKCKSGDFYLPKNCPNNICKGKDDGKYVKNKVCRSYYTCTSELFEQSDCPIGQFFNNATKNCETDAPSDCLGNFTVRFTTTDYPYSSKASIGGKYTGFHIRKYGYYKSLDRKDYSMWARPRDDFPSACVWFKYDSSEISPCNHCCPCPHASSCTPTCIYTGGPCETHCLGGMPILTISTQKVAFQHDDDDKKFLKLYYQNLFISMRREEVYVVYGRIANNAKYMLWEQQDAYMEDYDVELCKSKKLKEKFGGECGKVFSHVSTSNPLWATHWDKVKAPLDQWNHVCASHEKLDDVDGTNKIRLWLNGHLTMRTVTKKDFDATYNFMATNKDKVGYRNYKKYRYEKDNLYTDMKEPIYNTISLGSAPWQEEDLSLERATGSSLGTGFATFRGDMHSAYVWNRTLTNKEVNDIYQNSKIPTNELVVDWEEFRGQVKDTPQRLKHEIYQIPPESIGTAADYLFSKSGECIENKTGPVYTKSSNPSFESKDNCKKYTRCSYYDYTKSGDCGDKKINTNTGACEEGTPESCDDEDCLEENTKTLSRDCKAYYICKENHLKKTYKKIGNCSEINPHWNIVTKKCQDRVPEKGCPASVDGKFTAWSLWSECNSTKMTTRKRKCEKGELKEVTPLECHHFGTPSENVETCGTSEAPDWTSTVSIMIILGIITGIIGIIGMVVSFKFEKFEKVLVMVSYVFFFLAAIFAVVAPLMFKGAEFADCPLSWGMGPISCIIAFVFGFISVATAIFAQIKTKEHNSIDIPQPTD